MWDSAQKDAFETIKRQLVSTPVLAIYDPQLQTKVIADASSYGIGAVMVQKHQKGTWNPVAFISRELSSTEEKYTQIEKEALATTRVCERLADYLIGKTLKRTINPLCRFWAQRILMKCRQESSDCECVSCDSISLFLVSLVRNSQPLMRCHVQPPSLRRGSSKRRTLSSTQRTFYFNCLGRNCRRAKGRPNLQVESSLSIAKRDGQT